jgi:predicted  nucleic acid-binding Zn-ribbon protein
MRGNHDMEEKEKQGTFKIDLTGPDATEENISNIVHTRKPAGPKPSGTKVQKPPFVIFGFVAIVIIFIFGYFSLRSAITTIDSSGATGITNLSKDLNDKLTALNQQLDEQKNKTKNDLSDIEKKLKGVESGVATVNKAEKTGKSELQIAIAGLEKDLDPLKRQIEDLKQQIAKMIGKTDEAVSSMNKIQVSVLKNQQEIDKLSATNIDAVRLEAALKKERDANKQTINALSSDILTLKKSIKDLEERISKSKNTSSVPSSSNSTNQSSMSKSPNNGTSPAKSGGIKEEEIY